MLTIDANVWVASATASEAAFADAVALFRLSAHLNEELRSPLLAFAEAAGAAARKARDPMEGQAVVAMMRAMPNASWCPMDESLANEAADMAARLFLRGADAIYAAVAHLHQATLITLDRELRLRASVEISALTPSEWLSAQPAP
jgi:predicted nucleic acid-binding protein